jgi:hypothetical protein
VAHVGEEGGLEAVLLLLLPDALTHGELLLRHHHLQKVNRVIRVVRVIGITTRVSERGGRIIVVRGMIEGKDKSKRTIVQADKRTRRHKGKRTRGQEDKRT